MNHLKARMINYLLKVNNYSPNQSLAQTSMEVIKSVRIIKDCVHCLDYMHLNLAEAFNCFGCSVHVKFTFDQNSYYFTNYCFMQQNYSLAKAKAKASLADNHFTFITN
jgi:hypothetical protein